MWRALIAQFTHLGQNVIHLNLEFIALANCFWPPGDHTPTEDVKTPAGKITAQLNPLLNEKGDDRSDRNNLHPLDG